MHVAFYTRMVATVKNFGEFGEFQQFAKFLPIYTISIALHIDSQLLLSINTRKVSSFAIT